jgi:transposase
VSSGFDTSFKSGFDPEISEVRRLEVITGDGGHRRWPVEVKGQIVLESLAPGAVVSEVARRHGLRPQQLFNWRNQAKDGRLPLPEEALSFVPVVASEPRSSTQSKAIVEIHVGGAVIKVPAEVTPEHLSKVLRAARSVL